MNNLPKWKNKLISWIAGGQPVLINFIVLGKSLPDGVSAIYLPCNGTKEDVSFYENKAILVPVVNIK